VGAFAAPVYIGFPLIELFFSAPLFCTQLQLCEPNRLVHAPLRAAIGRNRPRRKPLAVGAWLSPELLVLPIDHQPTAEELDDLDEVVKV
jgi:hypothetical protein